MSVFQSILTVVIAVLAWQYYSVNYIKTKQAAKVEGYYHPSFKKVADSLWNSIEKGHEYGAAFSVYYKGEVLIDIWGGWADLEAERHWQGDTLSLSFSMVKGVAAVVMARLVDMGLLDYKKEVSHYWPEFGTEDKKNVTVEMLLSHQAGLLGFTEKISLYEYRDNWEKIDKLLATATPAWPPGKGVGYHMLTFGMYADALVRKVDPQHRNLSQFFYEEIAQPLDIEFYVGLPKEHYHRYARIRDSKYLEFRYSIPSLIYVISNPLFDKGLVWDLEVNQLNNPELLAVGLPSAMGIGPARGLAKMYDFLANGGSLKAKRLLSPELVEALRQPLTSNLTDYHLAMFPFSRGLILRDFKGHETVGHPGYGGNLAYADMTLGLGLCYTTNYLSLYLSDDPRQKPVLDAFYESFEDFKAQQKSVRRKV